MSKYDFVVCSRCGVECLDYTVRMWQRVCVLCVADELDELLLAVGKAIHPELDKCKPGRLTALRYVEQLARERDEGVRKGLLEAAEHCEGYAAVVADDPDDLAAEGPHADMVSAARALGRQLRELANRTAPATRPDPPPSAEARANRYRAMLDEAMSEYPSLRVKFAKGLKEIGGKDG